LSPEEGARRWSAFRNWRHVVVSGAGHMIQRDQPAAVAALLRGFLQSD